MFSLWDSWAAEEEASLLGNSKEKQCRREGNWEHGQGVHLWNGLKAHPVLNC